VLSRSIPEHGGYHRDDRGSVALVVMVLFVMASLATVMVARDTSELRSVRTSQDRSAALAATDAGMAAGVARAAVETSSDFTESGVAGDAAWDLTARRVSTDRWELVVVGTANESQRTASAGLVRRGGSGWVVDRWQEGVGRF
jgi:Tfp pilus assembly protein PilX